MYLELRGVSPRASDAKVLAEKHSKQRTTAYTGLLAHATDAQTRITLINTE
jgi:hypothetical protein